MTISHMFIDATRTDGDLAGVFEYDGETAYFYLYQLTPQQAIHGSIRVLVGPITLGESDFSVRWDAREIVVGLFALEELLAAFDSRSGRTYGGNSDGGRHNVPEEIKAVFVEHKH